MSFAESPWHRGDFANTSIPRAVALRVIPKVRFPFWARKSSLCRVSPGSMRTLSRGAFQNFLIGSAELPTDVSPTIVSWTNAGTYTDIWSFHDAAGNYQDASGTITDSIGQASATIV